MRLYDAIVVGGGPTGSYAANKLAGKGHNVVVLERRPRPGNETCTGIVGQECVITFNIKENVILRRVNSARIFSPSGNELRVRREEPQACILDRAAFDNSLTEQARVRGAAYLFNSLAEKITINGDKVIVRATIRGQETDFEAKAVVIASGYDSGLCQRLGLGRPGDFALGAQAEVKAEGLNEVEVYFGRETAPGFFAWLVPTVPPMARAGLLSRKNPGLYLKKWLESLAAQGKIATADVALNYGTIPLKPLPRTSGERLLVIGDAAGQVKPTSGGGIYYGLIGADVAATTLHQALENDDLSARRLAHYERSWRKRLGRELRIGYWARKLFERLNDRQIDLIFRVVEDRGIDEALLKARDISFDWHSKVILNLLRYQAVSRVVDVLKLPFGRLD